MRNPETTRFFRNVFILLAPLMALAACELWILPIDFFSYRPWEVMRPITLTSVLKGPFYPNFSGHFIEQGDLAFRSSDAVTKTTDWETDAFGHRNRKSVSGQAIDIVVVGDSNSAGCSLAQSEMFASQLEARIPGAHVYTYAPEGMPQFLSDLHFTEGGKKPKLVIFPQIERNLLEMEPLGKVTQRGYSFKAGPHSIHLPRGFAESAAVQATASALDRLMNLPSYNYFQARLSGAKNGAEKHQKVHGIYFFQGEKAMIEASAEQVAEASRRLKSYQTALQERGIDFLFFAIPNKETFFFENWRKDPPGVISSLTRINQEHGIDQINLAETFLSRKAQAPHFMPYHVDDTHWSAVGAAVAADTVVSHLKNEGKLPLQK